MLIKNNQQQHSVTLLVINRETMADLRFLIHI